jgi:hypothetical protein
MVGWLHHLFLSGGIASVVFATYRVSHPEETGFGAFLGAFSSSYC